RDSARPGVARDRGRRRDQRADWLRRSRGAPRRPAARRPERPARHPAVGAVRRGAAELRRRRRPDPRRHPGRDRDRGHRRAVLPAPVAPDPDRIRTVTEPMIEFQGVVAGYGGREVLRGVETVVGRGELVAIVGPNGAGKSTLLRLLTGVLTPTQGTVLLGGSLVRDLSRVAIARRVAVVPQVAALPFAARVEEVVALGRLPHEDPLRGPRAADEAAVAAAIARVGLDHLVGRDARQLSLGERQL